MARKRLLSSWPVSLCRKRDKLSLVPGTKVRFQSLKSAVRGSDLGLNPANDGQVIRINIPPLTEERRIEMVKMLGQKTEEARVAIRVS